MPTLVPGADSMKPPTPVRTFAEDEKERGLLGLRKKGMGVRTWMLLGMDGKVQVVEAGKHAIMRRAGLPGRDLRILDPLLSYPSTILGRERAIVLNLEHIKAIITAQEVLLLNSKDPAVAPFVVDLQRRLPLNFDLSDPLISKDRGSSPSDSEESNNGMVSSDVKTRVGEPRLEANGFTYTDGSPGHRGPNALPFEFRALEACLDATCRCLDDEATTLDNEAYPALDSLTGHISTLNLERVRQIKNRLVTISGRVQKVRDEIEKLLDDDGDMAEMYLTDKLMRQQFDGPLSPTSTVDGYNPVSVDGTQVPTVHFGTEPMLKSPVYSDDEEESEKLPLIADESDGANLPLKDSAKLSSSSSAGSSSSSSSNSSKNMDVEELEMLLEAYFVQIDGTANKLSALRDYVDDTEDYINIMLDDKQNHLLQMGVILTTATLVISLSVVVTGVFGMNIDIDWFQASSSERFYWVVGGSTVGSLLVYTVVIAWCKWKRLLE